MRRMRPRGKSNLSHSKVWPEARSLRRMRGHSWAQAGEGHRWLEHTFKSACQAPELLSRHMGHSAWFSICSMLSGSCGQNNRATEDTLSTKFLTFSETATCVFLFSCWFCETTDCVIPDRGKGMLSWSPSNHSFLEPLINVTSRVFHFLNLMFCS